MFDADAGQPASRDLRAFRGSGRTDRYSRIVSFLVAFALGEAANLLPLELLPGSYLHFASVPVLVIAARMGPLSGVAIAGALAAIRPYSGMWPYGILVFCAEALAVGMVRKIRPARNLLDIDSLFWPLIGAPILAIEGLALGFSPQALVATVLGSWLNGLSNSTVAALIADSPIADALLPPLPRSERSISEYLKLGVSAVVLPLSLLGIVLGIGTLRATENAHIAAMIRMGIQTAAQGRQLFETNHGIETGIAPSDTTVAPWRDGFFVRTAKAPASSIDRLRTTVYFGEFMSADGPARYVVAFEPFFEELYNAYLSQLLVRLLYFYGSYAFAILLAQGLKTRFSGLSMSARGLAERIERGDHPRWPEQDLTEFSELSRSFRAVSLRLHSLFDDLKNSRSRLAAMVEERTQELARRTGELRLLLARTEREREEDRRRIGQELHDELGQNIASLGMELFLLERRIPPEDARGREILAEMREILATLSESLKRLVADLRPGVLERLGLAAALENLAYGLTKRTGLRIVFESSLPATHELSPRLENALYRIAQEALSNAIRHSRASRIDVNLASDGAVTILQIRDAGIGFDLGARAGKTDPSFGILGMRERCLALGGTFSLLSKPGGGTLVSATFRTEADDAIANPPG